ncbi:uncharacterized protein METZ01_LOCUS45935 [marine metagenome]|uniref:Uncharacterized protein n=1 Tax=marine metagenome TaxID=408172 RepID=A0A381RPI6_9ZZZZ
MDVNQFKTDSKDTISNCCRKDREREKFDYHSVNLGSGATGMLTLA